MLKTFILYKDLYLFYLLIFALFFFYFFQEIKIPFVSYAFSRPLTFLIFIFLLTIYRKDFSNLFKEYKGVFYLFLFFVFINILSTLFNLSLYNYRKLLEGLGHILLPSFIFPICLILFFKNDFKRLIGVLILIAYVLFLANLFFLFNPDKYQLLYAHVQSYPRLGAFFQHPIGLGVFLVILALILIVNFYEFNNKIFYYFTLILTLLNLVISGAKSSFLLSLFLMPIAFFYVFLKNKDYKNFFLNLLILGLISGLFYLFWLSPKNIILSKIVYKVQKNVEFSQWIEQFYTLKTYQETTYNRRIYIWSYLINNIDFNLKNFLIGFGPYSLGKFLKPEFFHAHNLFLEFWISYGLVGIFYLFFIIYLIFKKLLRVKDLLLNLVFSYFLIHSLFDLLFFGGTLDLIFFSFLVKLIYYEKNTY